MELFTIIIIVLVLVGIFFLCRELNCWYWKVNARMDIMQKMVENQETIIKLLGKQLGEDVSCYTSSNSVVEPVVEPVEDSADTSLKVGSKVRTKKNLGNLPKGSIIRVDRISGQNVYCSMDMKDMGRFDMEDLEAI